MNLRAIRAIVVKDLTVLRHAKAVLIPLIVVPLVLLLVLPALAAFAPALANVPGAGNLTDLLEGMPEVMQARLAGFDQDQKVVVLLLTYLFAPLYLILPLMVASVIAADTFAGERERRTLEALLYTPTSDLELLLGKLLAGFLPALAVAWGGFVVYAVVANVAGWPTMGQVFFPTWMWLVLALWVAPAVAAVGLGATVIVSSKVSTFQEAYQIGAAVVLPIVLLVVGQAAGVVVLSTAFVAALGAVFWLVAVVLLRYGARSFRRGELMARA